MSNLLASLGIIWFLSAWITHVYVCILAQKWILLIVGAIFFPVGFVHGTGVWLGFF